MISRCPLGPALVERSAQPRRRRQLADQNTESARGKVPAVEVTQIDVPGSEVGLYRIAVLIEQGEEAV